MCREQTRRAAGREPVHANDKRARRQRTTRKRSDKRRTHGITQTTRTTREQTTRRVHISRSALVVLLILLGSRCCFCAGLSFALVARVERAAFWVGWVCGRGARLLLVGSGWFLRWRVLGFWCVCLLVGGCSLGWFRVLGFRAFVVRALSPGGSWVGVPFPVLCWCVPGVRCRLAL